LLDGKGKGNGRYRLRAGLRGRCERGVLTELVEGTFIVKGAKRRREKKRRVGTISYYLKPETK